MDDEENISFLVATALRLDGHEITTAATGREALARVRGLTIGGDDYMVKPFSIEELMARVAVILRRVGIGCGSAVLRAGDLELDNDAHRVTRGGVEVALSPNEYKLLRYLVANTGRVLTRSQILDHGWEYDFGGDSSTRRGRS